MRLKSELERELRMPITLKMGGPGTLNVYVNGQQIYSYQRTKRLPRPDELLAAIRSLQ
ncbi:MAG TPA: Rdx family protein [Terriglobales bacterium]|nr:Rdx family protein [Terriglobales bacterium]